VPPAAAPQCAYNGLVNGEVVVCINKSTRGYSHGGLSTSWTFPQKGVAWNLNWVAIHDPLRLSRAPSAGVPESTEKDYLGRQLKTLLHELEHVFGAGAGEYYNGIAVARHHRRGPHRRPGAGQRQRPLLVDAPALAARPAAGHRV
jgi:hypothetical protein